jgi:mRNA-degrading endonuclease RelE of RelBE toxin-antitoxin system
MLWQAKRILYQRFGTGLMTNKSPISVEYTDDFKRDVKRLHKKYRKIRDDVEAFILRLESGETPGDQVQGVGYTVYKARLKSSDLSSGKSGGYRVLYFIQTAEKITLLTIYVKTQIEDIPVKEIRRIIKGLGLEDS